MVLPQAVLKVNYENHTRKNVVRLDIGAKPVFDKQVGSFMTTIPLTEPRSDRITAQVGVESGEESAMALHILDVLRKQLLSKGRTYLSGKQS